MVGEVPVDTGDEDESGIAGMLSRLERERSLFYSDVSTGEKRSKKSTHSTEPWSGVHELQLSVSYRVSKFCKCFALKFSYRCAYCALMLLLKACN